MDEGVVTTGFRVGVVCRQSLRFWILGFYVLRVYMFLFRGTGLQDFAFWVRVSGCWVGDLGFGV